MRVRTYFFKTSLLSFYTLKLKFLYIVEFEHIQLPDPLYCKWEAGSD